MRAEFSMDQMVGTQCLCEIGLGYAKHHLPILFMLFIRDALFSASTFKPNGMLLFSKNKHVITRVTWMRMVVDPTHHSHGWFSLVPLDF